MVTQCDAQTGCSPQAFGNGRYEVRQFIAGATDKDFTIIGKDRHSREPFPMCTRHARGIHLQAPSQCSATMIDNNNIVHKPYQ